MFVMICTLPPNARPLMPAQNREKGGSDPDRPVKSQTVSVDYYVLNAAGV